MTDLGTLGGHYSYSYANGINDGNQIVGGSFTDALDAVYHAFLSDGTTMTDLNSRVTSKAADWVLSEATGINDAGVMVGNGTLAGQPHAFMLKPLLPGDTNADGKVHFTDLLTLAQHYGNADVEKVTDVERVTDVEKVTSTVSTGRTRGHSPISMLAARGNSRRSAGWGGFNPHARASIVNSILRLSSRRPADPLDEQLPVVGFCQAEEPWPKT